MIEKKRIGMILARDFPPDERPEKEALSLIEAGFDVFMLSITWQGRPLKENYKGIQINRFPMSRNLFRKLSPTYLAFPFYRRIWRPKIEQFVRENHINILHVHDLPMTDIAHDMAKKYGCKVVCDQHEYWSNWIINTAHYNTIPGKLINRMSNWKKYECENLSQADLVITVTEPLRKCYIEDGCIPAEKLITVPNTPMRATFNPNKINKEVIETFKNYFVIFYAGAMDILRGLDVVINALQKIEEKVPNIKFVLAGRFSSGYNPLQIAEDAGVGHLVDFVGWLDLDQLASYIAAASVCVFTPPATRDEINNTIATKIYQYLAMGKPIITSEAQMMHDFVVDHHIGWAIDSGDSAGFAKRVIWLAQNYQRLSSEIAQNCKKLIESDDIFWDQTIGSMLDAYQKL